MIRTERSGRARLKSVVSSLIKKKRNKRSFKSKEVKLSLRPPGSTSLLRPNMKPKHVRELKHVLRRPSRRNESPKSEKFERGKRKLKSLLMLRKSDAEGFSWPKRPLKRLICQSSSSYRQSMRLSRRRDLTNHWWICASTISRLVDSS